MASGQGKRVLEGYFAWLEGGGRKVLSRLAKARERRKRERVPHKLFRTSTGYQPPSLNGTFRRLLRDAALEKNEQGQTRTLYSLRHTYATLELLNHKTDIHTLSRQMGNSAAMLEKHYSKLTATMAADRLA